MLRLRSLASTLVVVAPVVIALPVVSVPSPNPTETVATTVESLDLPISERPGPDVARLVEADTGEFGMAAVSWADPTVAPTAVRLRHRVDGQWQPWVSLGVADAAPDTGSPQAAGLRGATEPLWVGEAQGVEVEVTTTDDRQLTDLRVDLIEPGERPADSRLAEAATPISTAVAAAADGRPSIIDRPSWGADESLRLAACPSGPSYTGVTQAAFIHHTASGNDYTADTAAAVIRSIYAYSVSSRGFCDIPYNFIVDKYGRIFEGRAGGIDAEVLGAHTGGFNTNTTAAAALGTFSTTPPPVVMLEALGTIVGWKLGRAGVYPLSTATLVASGGAGTTSRYPDGAVVNLQAVSGHRDVGNTECPGNALYPVLDHIRSVAAYTMARTPAKPPPETIANFVKALYEDFLGRPADSSGLTYWSNLVYRGLLTREGVALTLAQSDEWLGSIVADLYRDTLDREPDSAGLAHWIGVLRGGWSVALVASRFYGSEEYFVVESRSDLGVWVSNLYSSLLGRPADAAGRSYWVAEASRLGRPQVAWSFYQSDENVALRISRLYQHLLGRGVDPGGLRYWTAVVRERGDIALASFIAASAEYFARAQ